MPLDPVLKAFLDQIASQPGPKTWELQPPQAREGLVAMMGLVGPKDVPIGKITNILIPAPDGYEIPARVYTPVAADRDPLPTLVFFHGGGFVIGSVETHDGLCRILANESLCRVISVDYRLSPEHKYPVPLEDAVAALTWIEANAPSLGVDANRLAVGGDSAGGALAAVLAQRSRDKTVPRIAYQMLLFPVTQIGGETVSLHEFAEGYLLETQTLKWFYNHYLPAGADKTDPSISPLAARDLTGLPPAFVMLGGFDPLHDEGLQYATRMREAGVNVTVVDYSDMVHVFIYLQAVLPQAHDALVAAAAKLKAALTE